MPANFELSITRSTNNAGKWPTTMPASISSVAVSATQYGSSLDGIVPVAVSLLHGTFSTLRTSQADSPAFQAEWQVRNYAARQEGTLWRKHVLDRSASVDTDAIAETIDHVFQMASRFGPSSVDFRGLHAELVNGEHLAAALRAASSFNHMTPGWEDALQTAHDAIVLAGGDPYDALYGMIES